jgi:hypothetical protein
MTNHVRDPVKSRTAGATGASIDVVFQSAYLRAMLLVAGPDNEIAARLCEALAAARTRFERRDRIDFDAAWTARASALLLVEPLARAGQGPPAAGDAAALEDLLRAADAPGVSRILLITPRPDADGGLLRLRRSGAAYVVLRPAPLLDVRAESLDLAGRRVLVPRALAAELGRAVPVAALIDAVLGALGDASCTGRILPVEPAAGAPSALDALALAGARPRVVPSWRARIGSWLGRPTPRLEGCVLSVWNSWPSSPPT